MELVRNTKVVQKELLYTYSLSSIYSPCFMVLVVPGTVRWLPYTLRALKKTFVCSVLSIAVQASTLVQRHTIHLPSPWPIFRFLHLSALNKKFFYSSFLSQSKFLLWSSATRCISRRPGPSSGSCLLPRSSRISPALQRFWNYFDLCAYSYWTLSALPSYRRSTKSMLFGTASRRSAVLCSACGTVQGV